MRADRLVGLLLLLQRKGQITAAAAAAEFEVSERTARRDFEALAGAGFPVYSTPGRNGGWQLLGDGRTDLSGLTAREIRTLFLLAGPNTAATTELRSALRKLASALPEPMQDAAERATSAMLVDAVPWGTWSAQHPDPPFLDDVQAAVVESVEIELDYEARDRSRTTRVAHPLGLAAKGAVWYLMADTDAGQRTFRVDRISGLRRTGEPAVRPEAFDLDAAWAMVTDRVEDLRHPVVASGTAEASWVGRLTYVLGNRITVAGPVDERRVAIRVRGAHFEVLAAELAGFGSAIEIDGPAELRERLGRIGVELCAVYR